MRYFLTFGLLILIRVFVEAQINFNQGKALSENYYIELPYKSVRGLMIVSVQIGGGSHDFLFDTGSATAVVGSLKRHIPESEQQLISISDSQNNKDSVFMGILPEITLGSCLFTGIPAFIIKESVHSQCLGFEGIIGSNLLRNSVVQIDTKRHTIIITNDVHEIKINEKYESKMKLDQQSGPIIDLQIGGQKGKMYKVPSLFDSGADMLFDFPDKIYQRLLGKGVVTDTLKGEGANSIGIFGLEKSLTKHKVHIKQFKIGDAIIHDVWAESSMDNESKIGVSLAKYGRITLDYRNKKFYLEPFEESTQYDEPFWPISPLLKEDRLIIGLIWSNAPKNIQLGDEIKAIDGHPTEATEICQLLLNSPLKNKTATMLLLHHKDGSEEEVRIEKNLPIPEQ